MASSKLCILLYLCVILAANDGLLMRCCAVEATYACNDNQLISIPRGQKVSVVYWVGGGGQSSGQAEIDGDRSRLNATAGSPSETATNSSSTTDESTSNHSDANQTSIGDELRVTANDCGPTADDRGTSCDVTTTAYVHAQLDTTIGSQTSTEASTEEIDARNVTTDDVNSTASATAEVESVTTQVSADNETSTDFRTGPTATDDSIVDVKGRSFVPKPRPQSPVHYVSVIHPPDGVLQSLDKIGRRQLRSTAALDNSTVCKWIFKSDPAGVPLLLTFKAFSTPDSTDCKDHYIAVERDSNGFQARWCGTSADKTSHASYARNQISLYLTSSGNGSFPTGFSVEVQALDLKLLRKYAEVRRMIKSV